MDAEPDAGRMDRHPIEQREAAPLFIVGVDRSGTTLLRVLLDRHPDLAIPPESHFIPAMWDRRRKYGRNDRVDDIDRFLGDLANDKYFGLWSIPIDTVRRELANLPQPDFRLAMDAVFRAYAHTSGKRYWGDKTPDYVKYLPLLGQLFPTARFIHIIRDGRDVALSMIELQRRHRRAATVGFIWARRIRLGRKEGQRLGSERYMEVRYEDLVRNPRAELIRTCRFLQLPYAPRMLVHDSETIKQIPAAFRHVHKNLTQPPTQGLRDWRRDMHPQDVVEFEAIAGPELRALGYECGTGGPGIARRFRAWARIGVFALGFVYQRAQSNLQIRRPRRSRPSRTSHLHSTQA